MAAVAVAFFRLRLAQQAVAVAARLHQVAMARIQRGQLRAPSPIGVAAVVAAIRAVSKWVLARCSAAAAVVLAQTQVGHQRLAAMAVQAAPRPERLVVPKAAAAGLETLETPAQAETVIAVFG